MVEKLIDEVKKYSILYNTDLNEYRDQRLRQEAWEEIGKVLKISGDQAKENWDKLRRCFANAINRRINPKNGSVHKKTTAWKYEKKMAFLFPYFHSRKIPCNAEKNLTFRNLNENTTSDNYTENYQEYSQDDKNPEPEENRSPIEAKVEELSNFSQIENEYYSNIYTEDRSNNINDTKIHDDTNEASYELIDNRSNQSKLPFQFKVDSLDETDLFFLSMSQMTKKLPKIEQTKIKLTLSNTVLQAELKEQTKTNQDIRQTSNYYSYSCDNNITEQQSFS